MKTYWQSLSLVERIKLMRYVLPLVLIPVVLIYQLLIAIRLEEAYGHPVHYAAEISFYSLVGPVVTWMTLIWVERRLTEKEMLERQVHARTQQLASLTSASSDAILSLDSHGRITSWNQGAAALFGFSAEEMLGHPVSEVLPEAALSDGNSSQTSGDRQFASMALTRDGHRVRVDLTHTLVDLADEQDAVSLLIMRDITAQAERAALLEEERGRISRDLHDGVAQSLYFMALKADAAQNQVFAAPEEAAESLRQIGVQSRQAIRDVRRAIFGLRPLDWSAEGFSAALQQFIDTFGREMGIPVHLDIGESEWKLPPRLELLLFRLVQESLNNVAKHAAASQAQVSLNMSRDQEQVELVIEDNGRGFDRAQVQPGLGLKQMESRVLENAGTFDIISKPGSGTICRVRIPLALSGGDHGRN